MTQLAADDFNRADGGLGANWTTTTGNSAPVIATNEATSSGAGTFSARYTATGAPNDQYAEVTVGTVVSGSNDEGVGPACRIQSGVETFYLAQGNSLQTRLYRCSSGAFTLLGEGYGVVAGDLLRLTCNGSTISVQLNGYTIISATDANIGSGDAGIWITSTGSGRINAFAFGNLTEPTIEQEGYRWRDDDGDEDGATWLAAQDSNITRSAELATRIRMLLNATGDPASAQYRLGWRISGGTYAPVEVSSGSAVTFGAVGATTNTGTTAPRIAYPTGITEGQLLVLVLASRPNTSTFTTPSGWTLQDTATGGAGAEGAGTGTVRCTVFTKIADGHEQGSLSLVLTSGTSVGGAIFRVTRGGGKRFDVAVATGSDNSAGTTWSVTFGSDPGVTAGDLVFVASAGSEDTATQASQALAQTGVTYGAMTERIDAAITTGNDLRLVLTEHAITSGTSSAAATYTMTVSGTNAANQAGASIMIRVRQVDAAIKMQASANITASGENTTAQLTAPSGKSTSDFVAGRMQDDENPADAIDITTDDYTELEWCIIADGDAAANSDVYEFRVVRSDGVPLATYTVTPQWTIGAGGIEGDLAATEAQDTFAASGDVIVAGDLAATEAQDALAASGTVDQPPTDITGDLAATEAQDTAALAGELEDPATFYVIELGTPNPTSDHRITAIDDLEEGDLLKVYGVEGGTIDDVVVNDDATFDADEAVTSFMVRASDDGGVTWGDPGQQFTDEPPVSGFLDAIEAEDVAAIDGGVLVQGDMAVTEPQDVAAMNGGSTVQGTMAVTDQPDTFAASGDVIVAGDLIATDPQDVAAASGTVEQPDGGIDGSMAAIEAQDAAAAAGKVLISGDLAATEPQDVAAIEGDLEQPITGDMDATEAQDVAAITGTSAGRQVTALEAIAKIKAREVNRTAILTKHGTFAKSPDEVHHVNLEFDDLSVGTISRDDYYKRLNVGDRDEVNNGGALPQEAT